MAKAKKTVFFCQNCGYESAKWMGQCPGCKEWNTFVEETALPKTSGRTPTARKTENKPISLNQIDIQEDARQDSGLAELDRVLGGGIVPGSLVLVGGDPGIGKSTLLLQMCRYLSQRHVKAL